jgi:hypothetical protein
VFNDVDCRSLYNTWLGGVGPRDDVGGMNLNAAEPEVNGHGGLCLALRSGHLMWAKIAHKPAKDFCLHVVCLGLPTWSFFAGPDFQVEHKT